MLKPGGVLRLALPDLERGIAAYQRGDRDYFHVPDEDARSIGAKFVTQMTWYGYSQQPVRARLRRGAARAGRLRADQPLPYKQTASRWPDIVDLDNRERESLFVEAVK